MKARALLALLGGALYYLATGSTMLAAGLLLMRGRMLGGLLYGAVVLFTLLWSFGEVGATAGRSYRASSRRPCSLSLCCSGWPRRRRGPGAA
ncbi:hypothetical protein [Sphingopyxis terrae]|uniref:hypothetical protein n=1 Tax=Sphingopyxis terrae TaxID=33052 RepID=UPI000A38A96E|nr:hypothetical protein [Sphingopyxis terrae]PCF91371.1 hypothetical protein CPA46_07925 [Sphingopyxis terrae subsp. ummariensis]